jgi:hypothetical protein
VAPACLPACSPAFLPAVLPAVLPACLPACQTACLPSCLPACMSACRPVRLLTVVSKNSLPRRRGAGHISSPSTTGDAQRESQHDSAEHMDYSLEAKWFEPKWIEHTASFLLFLGARIAHDRSATRIRLQLHNNCTEIDRKGERERERAGMLSKTCRGAKARQQAENNPKTTSTRWTEIQKNASSDGVIPTFTNQGFKTGGWKETAKVKQTYWKRPPRCVASALGNNQNLHAWGKQYNNASDQVVAMR